MTNKSERAVSAMSEDEFYDRFPDEKAAIDWFIDIRYKGNLICPHCGTKVNIYRERKRLKVFHCSNCNNSFSPIKGTIFEKTHIDIRKWFKVIKNLLNDRAGYSACHVTRDVSRKVITKDATTGEKKIEYKPIMYKSAFRMLHQIRKAMANRETEQMFEAVVEVDETYPGGKPRKTNAVLDEKGNVIKPRKEIHHKRGRGTSKPAVVGVKERSTGHVYAEVMLPNEAGQELTGTQLLSVINKVCKKPPEDMPEKKIIVNTDGLSGYNILDNEENKKKYVHVKVNHSKGEYYRDGVHTNGIENFWGVVDNGVRGVYHHISLKYLQKYVDEFSFKQNTRLDKGMFDVLLGQCVLPQPKKE